MFASDEKRKTYQLRGDVRLAILRAPRDAVGLLCEASEYETIKFVVLWRTKKDL